MINVPDEYRDKKIISMIDSAILEGATCFDEIDPIQQDELVSCCIAVSQDGDYIDNLSALPGLIKFMQTGELDHAIDLAESMRQHAMRYAAIFIDVLFIERQQEIETLRDHEMGVRKIVDRVNGEILTVRS